MSIWKVIIATGLMLTLLGRPRAAIWRVFAVNFIGTMALAESPMAVAVIDIAAAMALLGTDKRANIVAALYVMMQPIYVLGFAFSWNPDTTFACIDVLAYVQLGVIGGMDRGVGRLYRLTNRWWNYRNFAVSFRHHAGPGLARRARSISEQGGGLNG